MKANELMIGDWVEPHQCMTPTVYCKVEGIYPGGTVHLDKAERLFILEELSPIPLTAEIFLNNGFTEGYNSVLTAEGYKKLPTYTYKNLKQAKDACRNIIRAAYSDLDGGKYDIQVGISSRIFDIEYVHQLQHALRLCGIDKTIEL